MVENKTSANYVLGAKVVETKAWWKPKADRCPAEEMISTTVAAKLTIHYDTLMDHTRYKPRTKHYHAVLCRSHLVARLPKDKKCSLTKPFDFFFSFLSSKRAFPTYHNQTN